MIKLSRRWYRILIVLVLLGAVPLGLWLGTAYWRVSNLNPTPLSGRAALYDVKGRLIGTLGQRSRPFLPLDEIAPSMRTAIVDIEDSRFWQHFGVDLRAIARAIWVDLRGGGIHQGASTITQQIAKMNFLTPQKTFIRKAQEAVYALLLETRFSKEDLLEIYLNTIYLGEGAYGVDEAALTYFDKPASELTLAESALLAGLPKAPSVLTPYSNPEGAIARRNVVLNRMVELGDISQEEADKAAQAPLNLAERRGGQAPYFADYVSSQLIKQYGASVVRNGGLQVKTTLDLDMQRAAQESLGDTQGALVAINPKNGGILAMVGGRDYVESQFNRAINAFRQPGSAFKPFVYAAALERGWQMNSLLNDNPNNFRGYQPQNFGNQYWGWVTMKHAITKSLNNASVWLLDQIGVEAAIEMAQRLGISTIAIPEDRNLALALGGLTQGVTPLNLASGYMAFANRGVRYEPYSITEVRDSSGRILFQHRPRAIRVLSEDVAYLLTNMLQSVVDNGTGRAANIGRPMAGKTGTTNDARNAWFVGYTPHLVASVYVGEDTNTPLSGGGGSLAAPIWGKFAQKALADVPAEGFSIPYNVQANVTVDIFTGLLANEFCNLQERDAFVFGQSPQRAAPCFFGEAQPQPYRYSRGDGPPPSAAPAVGPDEGIPLPLPAGLPDFLDLPSLLHPLDSLRSDSASSSTIPEDEEEEGVPVAGITNGE